MRHHHPITRPGRPRPSLRRRVSHALSLGKRAGVPATPAGHPNVEHPHRGYVALGPNDPEVRAAFPHVPPHLLRAAHASWRVLAELMHPPGRKWVGKSIVEMELPRIDIPIAGLDPGFDGYTIAFLSDIHAGPYLGADVLVPLFRRVSKEKPDLVILGGDLVNYDADEASEVAHALRHLHAKDGILSVPGNHDHYTGDIQRVLRKIEREGVHNLVNDATSIVRRGERLSLLGVDDGGAGAFDLARAYERSHDTKNRILISHTPDALPLASRLPIDLMLSGHTHGGQLRAPRVRPISTHTHGRYIDGFYQHGKTLAFVGRGVGVVCVPFRAFCPPHIPLIVLRSAEAKKNSAPGAN